MQPSKSKMFFRPHFPWKTQYIAKNHEKLTVSRGFCVRQPFRLTKMAAPDRLELTTLRLTAECSTDWAKGQYSRIIFIIRHFPGSGSYLFSRAVARKVFSAQVSLTTVFGMRTGGSSPPSPPQWYIYKGTAQRRTSIKQACVSLDKYLSYSPCGLTTT